MTAPVPTPAPSSRVSTPLAPGSVVGGRFVVGRPVSADSFGAVYHAHDQGSARELTLRIVAGALTQNPNAAELLKNEVRASATLDHKNIVRTFGMGQIPTGEWFVAYERVFGRSLEDILAQRRQSGTGGFSLRGSFNILSAIVHAVSAARTVMPHGALRPSVIFVADNGRVRVADFGISRAILRTSGAMALGPAEQGYIAPEVKAGQPPDPRSDIFGLGAIMYSLITGRSPADSFVTPSQINKDATHALDQLLMRCLTPNPTQRFVSAEEFRAALLQLASLAPARNENEFGADGVDEDEELAQSAPPPPRVSSAGGPPMPGARVSKNEQFRDISSTSMPTSPTPAPSDLAALLSKITENDAPRWMVAKDNLDHGPFSGRELVQAIANGEVLAEHGLVNLDTGERKKVSESQEFGGFAIEARKRIQKQQQAIAVKHAEKAETAGNAAKFIVLGSIVAAVAAVIVIYFIARPNASKTAEADRSLADLYARGNVKVEGTAGILPPPPPHHSSGTSHGSAPHGAVLSYEDAMNQAVNLGDLTGSGSEKTLTRDQVTEVMNHHINELYSCVSGELRAGNHMSRVSIDIAIAGSGEVLGATARGASAGMQSCVQNHMHSIHFPTFPAPRMGASFGFAVD